MKTTKYLVRRNSGKAIMVKAQEMHVTDQDILFVIKHRNIAFFPKPQVQYVVPFIKDSDNKID